MRRSTARAGGRRQLRPEESLQRALVEWLAYRHPELSKLTIHVPNGGARSRAEGGILKALGVRAGFPDLVCFAPRGGFRGLALELKAGANKPKPEQWAWLRALAEQGWRAAWTNDLGAAQRLFDRYAAGE